MRKKGGVKNKKRRKDNRALKHGREERDWGR